MRYGHVAPLNLILLKRKSKQIFQQHKGNVIKLGLFFGDIIFFF